MRAGRASGSRGYILGNVINTHTEQAAINKAGIKLDNFLNFSLFNVEILNYQLWQCVSGIVSPYESNCAFNLESLTVAGNITEVVFSTCRFCHRDSVASMQDPIMRLDRCLFEIRMKADI